MTSSEFWFWFTRDLSQPLAFQLVSSRARLWTNRQHVVTCAWRLRRGPIQKAVLQAGVKAEKVLADVTEAETINAKDRVAEVAEQVNGMFSEPTTMDGKIHVSTTPCSIQSLPVLRAPCYGEPCLFFSVVTIQGSQFDHRRPSGTFRGVRSCGLEAGRFRTVAAVDECFIDIG